MYAFEYHRPQSPEQAAAACEGDARFLAGGQSLIQAMKLRLSASERLVDLGAVPGLDAITWADGVVTVGAMARHADVARSDVVRRHLPGLAELAEGIGDPMVRTMGTLGGALANADPAACYPSAVLALGATVHTHTRTIEVQDFFTGLYSTALQSGELMTAVRFPVPQRAGYAKFKQPASRFALVGVMVAQTSSGVRVAVTGARDCVFREPGLEAALNREFTPEAARACTVQAEGLLSDLHASARYRAALIPLMAARAVATALTR